MFQDTGSDVGGRYPHRRSGMRLITQRSQVQILPPLQVKSQVSNLEPFGLAVAREDSAGNLRVRGPFSLRGGRASGVDVNEMSTRAASGRGRIGADRGGGFQRTTQHGLRCRERSEEGGWAGPPT